MQCPKCSHTMEPVVFEGIEVDKCSHCEGIWFDILEHEDLKKVAGSESIDTGERRKGAEYNRVDHYICPRCSGGMVRMVDPNQHHIWYELCHSCQGAFFDAGEFRDYKSRSLGGFLRDLFTGERG